MAYRQPVTVYPESGSPGEHGMLRDLSPLGLQLQTRTPLRSGQVIRLNGDTVAAIGRVVFCNRARASGRFICGIAFITVKFTHQAGTFVSENA